MDEYRQTYAMLEKDPTFKKIQRNNNNKKQNKTKSPRTYME